MIVYCTLDNKYYELYNVRDDKNGFPQFLVYKDKGEWVYLSAKHFRPNKDERKPLNE